jgi:hypothetical protein
LEDFLDEDLGKFCTILFILIGIGFIDDIMEENGELYDISLPLAQLLSLLLEGQAVPVLQQPENMLIAVIESPVF